MRWAWNPGPGGRHDGLEEYPMSAVATLTMPRLMPIKEAARLLGLGLSKVYALVDEGKIRSYRPSRGAVRIAESDLVEYIRSVQIRSFEDRKRVERFHESQRGGIYGPDVD